MPIGPKYHERYFYLVKRKINKVNHHELSSFGQSAGKLSRQYRLTWNIVASLQPGLSSFFSGFHSNYVGVERFLAVVLAPPTLPSLSPLPLIHQCDGCLEWGLMARLRGFDSHGGSTLSRGWLATAEAPGYSRQPPLI